MIDAFLVLKNSTGTVEGETTDDTFSKEKAIELLDFGFGDKALIPSEKDEHASKQFKMDEFKSELARKAEDMARRQQKTQTDEVPPWVLSADTLASVKLQTKQIVKQQDQASNGPDQERKRMKFTIVKDVDASSADLFQASCATAISPQPKEDARKMGVFESAEITLRKPFEGVPTPYLVCTFTNVTIESYSLTFDSGRTHLSEQVAFLFEKYKIAYTPQDAGGGAGKTNPVQEGSLTAIKKSP